MATRPCSVCEERAGDLLITLTETGATAYVCLPCAPPWLAAVWEMAGLPTLIFDVEDRALAEAVDEAGNLPAPDLPAIPVAAGPDDGEPDDDGGDTDQATPEGPGVLEMVERAEGRRAVSRTDYRDDTGPRVKGRGRPAVEAGASPATVD